MNWAWLWLKFGWFLVRGLKCTVSSSGSGTKAMCSKTGSKVCRVDRTEDSGSLLSCGVFVVCSSVDDVTVLSVISDCVWDETHTWFTQHLYEETDFWETIHSSSHSHVCAICTYLCFHRQTFIGVIETHFCYVWIPLKHKHRRKSDYQDMVKWSSYNGSNKSFVHLKMSEHLCLSLINLFLRNIFIFLYIIWNLTK